MIKGIKNGKGNWEKFEQTDLSEGTYPAESVWRPVGKYLKSSTTLRKDSVVVPSTLAPGDYILGWRWDGAGGNQVNICPCILNVKLNVVGINQICLIHLSKVWVSCASMRLVDGPSGRSDEEDQLNDGEYEDTPLYTDEEYAELEEAFENY